ncbi:hypothetical protein An15g03320 [Aspergillus niger]|uniref:Uncharacterized protein n=2 Tax=Aspergillus niger TaxID=5061 RepID=A2R5B2_ASPNC|nr:hypothetical protein An15g03320 [Aspergillus niger]CAK42407.1 hypothetical protein An15g03320 [Aspergillus niger]
MSFFETGARNLGNRSAAGWKKRTRFWSGGVGDTSKRRKRNSMTWSLIKTGSPSRQKGRNNNPGTENPSANGSKGALGGPGELVKNGRNGSKGQQHP